MADQTAIEWCEIGQLNPSATGRQLGAYKSAAVKCGCSLQEWIARRRQGLRFCFACRNWKQRATFTSDRSRAGGKAARCKPCLSDATTACRYGLSPKGLIEFRELHSNRCGICGSSDTLYVDHDHRTGKLRGLLCPPCNSAIGQLREDPALFAAALAYLEKHRG
jgi:hypothetical protein